MGEESLPDTIDNRYVVIEQLGSGGMAVVYKAHDPILNAIVAIKTMHPGATSELSMRFQQEARAVARLNHANILSARDFGLAEDGRAYLVLDYLAGESLDRIIKKRGTLPIEEAISIVLQVGHGLSYAHRQGILHRDIKPSNIMITTDENGAPIAKILDFGLARLSSSEPQFLTQVGQVMGSPLYMSPEQARGESVDERSDIYSLGCVIFTMLTGEPPIQSDSTMELFQLKQDEESPLLGEFLEENEFPELLENIVARCLERLPDDRYRTVDSLVEDLVQLQTTDAETRRQKESNENQNPERSTSPAAAGMPTSMIFVSILVILGGSLIGIFYYIRGTADDITRSRPKIVPSRIQQMSQGIICKIEDTTIRLSGDISEQLMRKKVVPKILRHCMDPAIPLPNACSITDVSSFDGKALSCLVDLQVDPQRKMKLRTIEMLSVPIDDEGFRQIGRMEYLEKIVMDSPQKPLGAFAGEQLAKPKVLSTIDVIGGTVSDDALQALGQIDHPFVISLLGSKGFSGTGLSKLKNVTHVVLGDAGVTPNQIDGLAALSSKQSTPKLATLSVDEIPDANVLPIMQRVGRLQGLTYLRFRKNHFGAGSVIALKDLRSLNMICFDNCKFLDDTIGELSKLKQIENLKFEHVKELTDKQLLTIASAIRPKVISLRDNLAITEDVVRDLKKMHIECQYDGGHAFHIQQLEENERTF